MSGNLLAMTAMLGAFAAAGCMLWRHMARYRSIAPACGRCGTPGEEFEAFICPTCGMDARSAGLTGRYNTVPLGTILLTLATSWVLIGIGLLGHELTRTEAHVTYADYAYSLEVR